MTTPKELGYFFPAEWHPHTATWLSWPHKEASWPGKIDTIYPYYAQFIKAVAACERVCINVGSAAMQQQATQYLKQAGAEMNNILFFQHPTNDAWCRDHGPAFLINPQAEVKKVIVDWDYNAWGGKYPPFDLDCAIPTRIGEYHNIPVFYPGIVM
jgi:agmatine deiminase